MSLFRKPKKPIQRRVFTEKDDDEDEESNENSETPSSNTETTDITTKKKLSKSKAKTQTLLSFETEEEGEVFQIKKSSHSKKIMRMFEKERQKRKESKTTEKNEVKPNTKTEIVTDDLVLVVNPSHKKPATPPPPLILSGRDALCAGKDDLSSDEDDMPTLHRFSKPENFKQVLESGAIPDAAMIHAARKKRQRAREMGDYVPVEDEEQQQEDAGRLLREDDNDGSEDERLDMDVNLAARDQERRRERFLAAQESDHEVDEWEDQQIRKGVTGASAAAINQELLYSVPEYQSTTALQQQQQPAAVMDPGIPRTPQAIAEKLKEHYESLCTSKEANVEKLQKTQEEITQATEELKDLQTQAPIAAEKFRFYQELRGYVTDLVECLDEKVGIITSLEERAINLMAKRAEWLVERRRQDVRDQAEETTNASKGIQMQRRGVEDEEKVRRAAEREGRRSRRRRAREIPGQPKHVEGMSSDDEIPQQDMLAFDKEKEQIELEAQEVFEDVVDDYSSITSILIKFEQWREADMVAYTEAYATLCLPRVVSPLIRLNLIFWDPLSESVDLEKLEWYRTLALYGLHDDESELSLSQDPDINLIPTIVEKVIIPRLTLLVDKCWDPLSSSQTLRLVGVLSRYIRRFPSLGPASKSLNNLFNAVLDKLKNSLEHDVFIPIIPKLAESKSPFFQRQFASGLKLLRNITSWQGIINDNSIKELALNALLNRYLLSAVKVCVLTDAIAKVGLISLILPRIWLQNNIPELQMFSSCVTNLAKQLDKNNPLHIEPMETLTNILKSLRA